MRQLLRNVTLLTLTAALAHPLVAAEKTVEDQRAAKHLASSGKTEAHWRILTSGHSADLSFFFQEMASRLFGRRDNTDEIILERMTRREMKILNDFFASPSGVAFLRHQDRMAADLAPVVGKEIMRIATGAPRNPRPAQGDISPEKSLFMEDMRPLVRSLFEESFYEYKNVLLDNLNQEERGLFEGPARRFDLRALEDAYLLSLGKYLSEREAQETRSFFSDPDAIFAYRKYASCRRESICRVFAKR